MVFSMTMKRLMVILLALAVALCGLPAMAEGFEPAATYEVGERSFNAGELELIPKGEGGGSIDTVRFAGVEGQDYTDEKVYTLRSYLETTTNMDWNPHTWEVNESLTLLDLMSMGLYTFVLNEDCTGYSVMPEMAAELPVDVTDQYVGQLGVQEGDVGKAWRIALNPDATWSVSEAAMDVIKNGLPEEAAAEEAPAEEEAAAEEAPAEEEAAEEATEYVEPELTGEALDLSKDTVVPITADDYIYSMQQQLNPKMLNRRADSYYAGSLVIYNAKNYLYSGKTAYDPIEGAVADLIAEGKDIYFDMSWWGVEGALDHDGNAAPKYVSINDETEYRDAAVEDESADEAWVSAKYIYDTYLADGMDYAAYQGEALFTADIAPETSWDDVGLKKVDDYTIDLILQNPMEDAAFYLPYNLSSNWLVYEPLYEACKSFFKNGQAVATEEEADEVTTRYCRSVETSVSYAPYELTYFELDKQISFSRNENWYGYHDGKHLGMYQTDNYSIAIIPEHNTRMMAFLSGKLDEVSLQSEDMEKYASSEYISYTPQTYTTKVTFNTDYEKLLEHGTGSQILVIDEFREAFANAIDRQHFATAYTAAGTAGFGLLNNLYIYNPFTGENYRSSEPAKRALANVYGLTYGEGGEYETLDEAYGALTGYDMEKAKSLMVTAYDKAVAAGIYDGESEISIDFRVYQNDTIYVQMFNYFKDQLEEACKGSGFEGKVTLKMTVDEDYYETMYSGNADAIFTTWGGAAMDPFTIMAGCYTDDAYGAGQQMEYGYDTSKIDLTFVIDGEEKTMSLQAWSKWANDEQVEGLTDVYGAFRDYDYDTRCAFTAGMEECFLNWYACTPVYYRNVASLDSQKVHFAVPEYLNELVLRGGIAFMTYNYDDAAWDEYVAANPLVY